MLRTRVLINHIYNLHDARYFAGMGASILGIDIESGYQNLTIEDYKSIISWLSGVDISVTINDTKNIDFIKKLNPQFIQTKSISIIEQMNATTPCIYELEVEDNDLYEDIALNRLASLENKAELFILRSNETIDKKSISIYKNLAAEYKILLNFNFDDSSLHYILDTINPYGIVLNKSNTEIKKGFNDFEKIHKFLDILSDI